MELSQEGIKTLNVICATLSFNSERIGVMEKLLKKFLLEQPKDSINIKNEVKGLFKELFNDGNKSSKMESEIFYSQDALLSIPTAPLDALEYVLRRYNGYNKIFKEHFGYEMELALSIGYLILIAMGENSIGMKFVPEVYAFKSKEEEFDMEFIELPGQDFIENWNKIMSVNMSSLTDLCQKDAALKRVLENLEALLKTCSFDLEELKGNPSLRFKQKPVFRIDKDRLYVLVPSYLNRNLPQNIELMLRECKGYSDVKGKAFEEMSLDLINKVSGSKLFRNVKYDEFELDGLLNLSKSSWFIECSSHPPSIKALLGNEQSVNDDIEKTVIKCENQAIRAIDNSKHPNISRFSPMETKGSIIILEGIYPSQNTVNALNIFPKIRVNLPRYIINYFDLQEMLRQPDAYLFEEFLLWRTQDDMPIVCMDERDYWEWFSKMKKEPERQRVFEMLKKNHNTLIYTGEMFSDKRHLRNLT